jgi:hypothetical protein
MQFALCEFNNCCRCDLYVTVRQTMPVMLGRTDVFSHFTPESRSPLYPTTKAPRRADILYQKSTCTELSNIIHSLPALEIPPDIWMQAWLRSLQVNLALRWDPIMIQCTLSSRETACMACSHAPPELPARSGRNRNTKVTRIGVLSGRFCGCSYVWLVPEWYLIYQANFKIRKI